MSPIIDERLRSRAARSASCGVSKGWAALCVVGSARAAKAWRRALRCWTSLLPFADNSALADTDGGCDGSIVWPAHCWSYCSSQSQRESHKSNQ